MTNYISLSLFVIIIIIISVIVHISINILLLHIIVVCFNRSQNPSIQTMYFFSEEKILKGALEKIIKCLVIWNNLFLHNLA